MRNLWLWLRAVLYMLIVGGVQFGVLPGLALLVEQRRLVSSSRCRSRPIALLGAGTFGVGAAIAVLAAFYLVTRGRGTPFPLDPTRVLVTTGPYGLVRNPQGIAAALMATGEILAFRSRWLWILLPLTLIYLELLATPIEDRQLARQFGRQYLSYKTKVPRWFPF